MKETVFQFELCFQGAAAEEALRDLQKKLAGIEGVLIAESSVTLLGTSLAVRVHFDNSAGARKLHRKVVNTIIGHAGVSISQMTTTLTDIF